MVPARGVDNGRRNPYAAKVQSPYIIQLVFQRGKRSSAIRLLSDIARRADVTASILLQRCRKAVGDDPGRLCGSSTPLRYPTQLPGPAPRRWHLPGAQEKLSVRQVWLYFATGVAGTTALLAAAFTRTL